MPNGKPEDYYDKADLLLYHIYDLCKVSEKSAASLGTVLEGSAQERFEQGGTVMGECSYKIAIHAQKGMVALTNLTLIVNSEILWLTKKDLKGQGYYEQMYQTVFKDYLESLNLKMTPEILFILVALHEIGHLDTLLRYIEIGDANITEQAIKILDKDFTDDYFSHKQAVELRKQKNIHPRMEFSISENLANRYMYINFYRVYNILLRLGLVKPQNKGGQS